MIGAILSLFGRCAHTRTTWPQTIGGVTYIACCSCGKTWEYLWSEMRRGEAIKPSQPKPQPEPIEGERNVC